MQQSNSHSNLYGDELFKSNIEDAKTSTHKKNKLTEPLDSFTSARSRGGIVLNFSNTLVLLNSFNSCTSSYRVNRLSQNWYG